MASAAGAYGIAPFCRELELIDHCLTPYPGIKERDLCVCPCENHHNISPPRLAPIQLDQESLQWSALRLRKVLQQRLPFHIFTNIPAPLSWLMTNTM